MKKRYIVCVNNSTKEQDEKFVEFIKSKNLGWWHWLNNTWLLVDDSGILTAADIRDSARDIFTPEYNIVIEIGQTTDTWSGFGIKTEDKNMFAWLHKNWKK